jgi:GR25 family glycosyltransferase involved in LPS biosynthesis
MLKIGISYYPDNDLFFSGKNQTALLLAELFSNHLGCHVILIDGNSSDKTWWDDYPKPANVTTLPLIEASSFDYFIDIDGLIHPDSRARVASRSIVFLRSFVQFTEMDNSVYYENKYIPRYFERLHAIWCWDILNPIESLDSIQTLFSCPIQTVPFVWSPTVISHYQKPINMETENTTWTVHVAEKNLENTSSCVIPLVAIRELVRKNILSANYKVHNMERIKDNKFLKENVLDNIEHTKLPLEFITKEPFYEWNSSSHILFSHSRFVPLSLRLLHAIWLGIPVIHNSPILRDLHPVLQNMFYFGNQIDAICQTFLSFSCHWRGFFASLNDIRQTITQKWGMQTRKDEWMQVLQTLNSVEDSVSTKTSLPSSISSYKSPMTLAFSDMWPGFNYDQNFIMDALRQEVKLKGLPITFQGVQYDASVGADLVFFGPYSHDWKKIPEGIPKVYFSAENWQQPNDASIDLFITSSRVEDKKHLRIPTWMTFIDWFTNSTELPTNTADNPIRIPVHFATRVHPVSFEQRTEFCGFVVSNPICPFRNDTFQAIHQYKHVNSGGSLFNNIGGQLELKYPGGGCGDLSKHHFFAKHRFTISFENSQAPGYITEKVLHAKMAGCVPLYWGDKNTDSDFVSGSIVNLSHLSDPSQVVDILKKLEANPTLCQAIASTPLLNAEKKMRALEVISNMANRILSLLSSTERREPIVPVSMPKMIDKIYCINLDTRKDRWDNLIKSEPYLESMMERIPGVNGKTIQMNRFIYDLFLRNEFKWKKSVIGCNLSHMTAWSKVATGEAERVLILEDDVRFEKDWLQRWDQYAEHIPADADVLYLGGVLPPNKPALPHALEAVNSYWSRVKPNTFFSPVPMPVFHFCAYSYILTKSGAKKIIDYMKNSEQKSFTVSDHLLGHPLVGLTKYIAQPLLSYCFQEEDPTYVQSQFNDIHRKDTYDSDIWNNTECFTEEDLKPFQTVDVNANVISTNNAINQEATTNELNHLTMYYVKTNDEPFEPYEQTWLEEILQRKLVMQPLPERIPAHSWVVVQRPHSFALHQYFQKLNEEGIPFKVLHISDEFGSDCIDFYQLPNCKGVIRNYIRPDVPKLPHIIQLPLGYHHKASVESSAKPFDERKFVWTFHGTNWFGRQDVLSSMFDITPNHCILTPDWNHPSMISGKEYISYLSNTKFVPVLRGNNPETFRFYEALESGCIPLSIKDDSNHPFYDWIFEQLFIRSMTTEEATALLSSASKEANLETIRKQYAANWSVYKTHLKQLVQTVL